VCVCGLCVSVCLQRPHIDITYFRLYQSVHREEMSTENLESHWLLRCYNWPCPMYHHKNTNCWPCRCCSMYASYQCTNSMAICAQCMDGAGDTSWQRVNNYTNTYNARTGELVHTTRDSQEAGQAAGHACFYAIIIPFAHLITVLLGAICWLASTPGFLCGNNAMPEHPNDEWVTRCFSRNELGARIHGGRYGICEACCYACYRGENATPAEAKSADDSV
jgi:hypothetical protein